MLHALKLNNNLAMELQSTQAVTRCATRIPDTKYKKTDLKSNVKENQAPKHRSTKEVAAASQEI
jgi:hypothetical protein